MAQSLTAAVLAPYPGGIDPVTRDQLCEIRALARQMSEEAIRQLLVLDEGELADWSALLSREDVLDHLAEGERDLYIYIGRRAEEVRADNAAARNRHEERAKTATA